MHGETSDGNRFVGLLLLPLPRRGWRRACRYRIGPLRTAGEATTPSVLRGMRSGAVAGLAIVAVLGLPVLLVLGTKAPAPSAFEPPARVWAAAPATEAPVRARAEASDAPAVVATALAEPSPVRAGPSEPRVGGGDRPFLSVDLIPVLDDESGTLAVEEPPVPVVKPVRTARVPVPPRVPKSP